MAKVTIPYKKTGIKVQLQSARYINKKLKETNQTKWPMFYKIVLREY